MTPNELMADFLARNGELLKWTLGDFSEQDMFVRPVPGANHAAWQLGHLIGSAAFMINQVTPGAIPDVAGQIGEKCTSKTSAIDDPAQFPTRGQMLDVFTQVHAAACEWARNLSAEELAKPTPGRMGEIAPTVAHLVLTIATHINMHIGQIQVIRRKLGKPLLF